MILHDPYSLHRHWWDPEWKPQEDSRDWTDWDFILADCLQLIEDYTDSQTGQYLPYDQSGEVFWDVKSKFSGSAEAIEKKQKERGELKPGESLYAVPTFRNPDKKPTLLSWSQDMAEEKADRRPDKVRNARPPTAEERAKMKAAKPTVDL